ncbi:hypothetical protein JST97_20135 [bacterium]|nr:hypothetical protein [bacterium]
MALRHLSQAKLPDFQPQLEALGEALSRLQSLELQEEARISPLSEPRLKADSELRELEHKTPAILAARQVVSQAEQDIWALVTGPCPTPELAVAWEHWQNTKNREWRCFCITSIPLCCSNFGRNCASYPVLLRNG